MKKYYNYGPKSTLFSKLDYKTVTIIVIIILIQALISSPFLASVKVFATTTGASRASTSSTPRGVGVPTASVQWEPKLHPGVFEQVNERYLISKGKSQVNNPNFKFFSDKWYEETHGTVIVVKFTVRNANPSFVAIKLINVLNAKPGTRQTFNELKLGNTITTLPLAADDNNQKRHFLISNDVASGYYVLNLIPTFGDHTSIVYTGKIFVPATKTPAGSSGHSTTVVRSTTKVTSTAKTTGGNFSSPPPLDCPNGARRLADGTCPTSPSPGESSGTTSAPIVTAPSCPDGSQPAADGSCPLPPPPDTTPPPPDTTPPPCTDGSQPASDRACSTPGYP